MTVTSRVAPVTQFLWGANLQNTFTIAYPSVIDSTRFWRDPWAGSESSQVNDGQDAWILGRSFRAAMTVRYLRAAAWCDFQRFLDWAPGNVFSWVPDAVNAPLYALPGCILVSPFDDVSPTPEDDGSQSLAIEIRNPTYDLGLAWR